MTLLLRHAEISRLAWAARTRNCQDWEPKHRPMIDPMRASGVRTLREIAEELNKRGEQTAWGSQWTKTQVHRVLKRTPD